MQEIGEMNPVYQAGRKKISPPSRVPFWINIVEHLLLKHLSREQDHGCIGYSC